MKVKAVEGNMCLCCFYKVQYFLSHVILVLFLLKEMHRFIHCSGK